MSKKKIVCLGGGNAMPKAVLAGLKRQPVELSVICAMLDSGGSAGKERELYKTNVSFGDIRRSFLELSELSQEAKDVLAFRDSNGTVIANVLGTAAVCSTGNYEKAFKAYRELLQIPSQHQIFPSTIDNATLYAVLENGEVVEGEANIDVPKHNSKVSRVYLEPKPIAYPKAVEAIENADLIIIGPGDLYSSLMQILLINGISEAINKSKAKKVYICNIMTKKGETDDFSVLDFTNEIEKYLKGKVNFVIYSKAGDVKINQELENNKKFIHNSDKLVKILCKL